jgi:AcrR family transcriptional regulator
MTASRPRPRAPRRSSGEVRRLLLNSAEQLFIKQGYQATTTNQIIELARVDAPTLYRHFANKAELFEATALAPLDEFIERHLTYWTGHPVGQADAVETVERYVTSFFTLLHQHRATLRLLIGASHSNDQLGDLARSVAKRFADGLVPLRDIVAAEEKVHHYGLKSPETTLAATTGMVLAMVLFDDWVFPSGRRPSRKTQLQEIVDLLLYGITVRPGGRPDNK